jgi:hypothetical protein
MPPANLINQSTSSSFNFLPIILILIVGILAFLIAKKYFMD